MTRKTIPLWFTVVAFLLLLAAAGVAIYRQAHTISGQASQLSERAKENDALRRQLRELSATPTAPAASEPAPAPSSTMPRPPRSAPEALAVAEQRVRELQASLAQSNSDVARIEARTSDLQSRADAAAAENHRMSVEQESGVRDLAAANQAIETLRAELKTTTGRLAQLETDNARSKQDGASAKQSATQLDQTVSDLEDVFRRREMYLSNILRRYREITEQYRSLSGVMDSRRDRPSAPASSPEISHIQNAITLTEEDLRQIHALDAQAERLEKKLPSK
jgi:DNA repair exonuclease SbcCD ATPase subunit